MGYSYEKDTVAGIETLIREKRENFLEFMDNYENLYSPSETYNDLYSELVRQLYNTQNAEVKKALLGEGLDDKERVSAILSLSEEKPHLVENIIQSEYLYNGKDCPKLELRLGNDFDFSLEQVDTLLRDRFSCSEEVIKQAIENVIESPDKQVAEFQSIEESNFVKKYDLEGLSPSLYKEEVAQTLYEYSNDEDWLEEMADYVTENGYTLKDDIVTAEEMVWDFLEDKIVNDENTDLPLATDEEIFLNLKEAMGNEMLEAHYREKLTLSDYFDKEGLAEFYVKECYSKSIALEALDFVVESVAENVREVLDKREAEKADVEYDD